MLRYKSERQMNWMFLSTFLIPFMYMIYIWWQFRHIKHCFTPLCAIEHWSAVHRIEALVPATVPGNGKTIESSSSQTPAGKSAAVSLGSCNQRAISHLCPTNCLECHGIVKKSLSSDRTNEIYFACGIVVVVVEPLTAN